MRRKGLFGEVEVRDEGLERSLYINGQKQGGSYLRPSAAIVDDRLPKDAPGPISSSFYPLGWLLGGVMSPGSSSLMIGLGSGAGAVQLLYNFPHIDLTVVEIDPVTTQAALDSFPLLEYYLDRGQLNIVIADASDYLEQNLDEWDFGCADAYDGGQAILDGYMELLCRRCRHVYVNVIDRFHGMSMRSVAEAMAKAGCQVAEVFRAVPQFMQEPYTSRANWILTSEPVDLERAAVFTPFVDIDDVHALDTQQNWDTLLASALSAVA